MADALRN